MGFERISMFLAGLLTKAPEGYHFKLMEINGQMGILAYVNEQPYHVVTFHIEQGQIQAMYNVLNPDKLRHLSSH
ncbi:RNA polymerase sigma factor SigJ [compost metagenome]